MQTPSIHTENDRNGDDKKSLKAVILGELKFFAGLAVFMFFFFNFVFGHYKIPSESMQPTLEVGDHLYVSKFAYGFSRHSMVFGAHKLPFLGERRLFGKLPKRGDVVVFRNPNSGLVMIKRVVGLPGDKVQTARGRLYVNDQLIARTEIDTIRYREHKGAVQSVSVFGEQFDGEKNSHVIYERTDDYGYDNQGPYILPQGKVFVMGDNRDNSEDSRAPGGPGFVPLDHLIGRADMMVFSFKTCKKEAGLFCPPLRFFKNL